MLPGILSLPRIGFPSFLPWLYFTRHQRTLLTLFDTTLFFYNTRKNCCISTWFRSVSNGTVTPAFLLLQHYELQSLIHSMNPFYTHSVSNSTAHKHRYKRWEVGLIELTYCCTDHYFWQSTTCVNCGKGTCTMRCLVYVPYDHHHHVTVRQQGTEIIFRPDQSQNRVRTLTSSGSHWLEALYPQHRLRSIQGKLIVVERDSLTCKGFFFFFNVLDTVRLNDLSNLSGVQH